MIVRNQRKQSLLEERVQSYIGFIITNGCKHSVSKSESGVKWIGTIPSHWKTIRCKYLFSERDERSSSGEEQYLSMSQKYGLVPDSYLDEKRLLSQSYTGGKICYKDDLVLNRLKAHLGVFALSPQLGVISPDYTVLIPNKSRILPEYAEMVLKSAKCRRELRIRVRGIVEGFWRLYTNDFGTIVLPIPPLSEQEAIMSHISEYLSETNKYKNIVSREISSLEEMKSRLISDAVTGKIDVGGIEIPEYEYVADSAESNETDEETEETLNEE